MPLRHTIAAALAAITTFCHAAAELPQAPAAALNGHPIATLAARAGGAPLRGGDVVLLTSGARALLAAKGPGVSPRDAVAGTGFEWLAPVGKDAALLRVDHQPIAARSGLALAPLTPELRVHRELEAHLAAPNEDTLALVLTVEGDAEDYAEDVGRRLPPGVHITGAAQRGGLGRLGVEVAPGALSAAVERFATESRVVTIMGGGGAKLLNISAKRIVQSGDASAVGDTLWARGLYGDGQIVAILDTGADYRNCYLSEGETDATPPPVNQGFGAGASTPDLSRRKIISYNMLHAGDNPANGASAYDNQGHGTYVAGNVGASAASAPFDPVVRNGPAPAAKFVIQDGGFTTLDDCSDLAALGCPVIDLTTTVEQAYAQGARIHNNSWGDRENFNPQNTYTAICVDFDDMVWRNPDFLIVCAAGNSASLGNGSVGSPSVAKNVLSIAGTQNPNLNTIISFSSIGWADDGRIKPDLAAPASTSTSRPNSTYSDPAVHCLVSTVQGTSMASPMSAGAAALVREYFAKGWYPGGAPEAADEYPTPSAALVKAVMVNGAIRVANEPVAPSRRQGWGRVMLEEALYFAGEARRLVVADRLAEFDDETDPVFELELSSSGNAAGGNFTVTLAYTDYPALAGAVPALVNDLDLEVESPSGTVYRGNVFDGAGLSATGGAADSLNNVEKAVLPIAAGVWKVRVRPSTIIEPGQGFALSVLGDVVPSSGADVSGWSLY
ncbi:MAG: S8 family serine peptidase [Candidatus Sumerlaeia bacterium]|nr:S8 family serine peptidase [Candidatus Sumerlaeia bacterium]